MSRYVGDVTLTVTASILGTTYWLNLVFSGRLPEDYGFFAFRTLFVPKCKSKLIVSKATTIESRISAIQMNGAKSA